jgi:hypothetical protein
MPRRFVLGVLLLAVISGCGEWGKRSSEQEFRPYASYSASDLASLADAYRAEVTALQARYDAAKRALGGVRDRQALGQQVREFERVRRRGEAVRALGTELSEREATLREVERELSRREGEERSWFAALTGLFSS